MSAAITKDSSIWRMVGGLAERLDFQQLQIIDHWDADLFAVGVARADDPAQLVYVSTFRQGPGRYSYECEQAGVQSYEVAEQADGSTFDQLVDVIQRHLSVGPARSP